MKERDDRSATEPGPRVLLIATLVAFGGAIAVYGFRPWGPWVAYALMAGWAMLLFVTSTGQDRRDRRAGRVPEPPKPRKISVVERILRVGVFLVPAACFGYSRWLQHRGAAPHDVQALDDNATLLLFLSYFFSLSVEMIFSWLDRRRTPSVASRV